MYGGVFICVYICRLFPLPEDFLTDAQTDAHFVRIDIRCVIHNLRV